MQGDEKMHKIFWDMGMVAMLTSDIDAANHKHWMLQLFYMPEGKMNLKVGSEIIQGKLLVVNQNRMHSFQTNGSIHFSMLITPGTELCEHLTHAFLEDRDYYDFSLMVDEKLEKAFQELVNDSTVNHYKQFKNLLLHTFHLEECEVLHENESRIAMAMKLVENENLSIQELAEQLALSPSRLAHLFKEETKTPLKSFLLLNQMFIAFEKLFQGESITDAALESGFDSPSHFAATTKKMMGESPSKSLKDSEFLKVYL